MVAGAGLLEDMAPPDVSAPDDPDDMPPGAVLLLFEGSPCVEEVDGADPASGPAGFAVEPSPLVAGAVCICPLVCADCATAEAASPMLKLSPIAAIINLRMIVSVIPSFQATYARTYESFRGAEPGSSCRHCRRSLGVPA